jgi:hypothetical protein
MAAADFTTLEAIFRMMAPSDITGAQGVVAGKQKNTSPAAILQGVLNTPGGGMLTVSDIKKKLEELSTNVDPRELHKILRFYSTEGNFETGGVDWQLMHPVQDDPHEQQNVGSASQITGIDEKQKRFGIMLSDAAFISPMTSRAAECEVFMNSVPSFVMSRCVPYLNVEMVFDRTVVGEGTAANGPSLLKFLLGAKDVDPASPDGVQVAANRFRMNDTDPARGNVDAYVAGMELFTAPQSFQDPRPSADGSRYVSVADPFRPLASVDALTINVAPTVGLMSYKTANLQLKLHDRSRLGELADLIQPLIYTRTTLWLTYGWRHPDEPGNPYAEMINGKMMTREAYGIANSSYSFDTVGQVVINLQLYTKGVRELKDIRVADGPDSFQYMMRKLEDAANLVKKYRQQLNLDPPSGILKEIRPFQILDAASQGSFPNLKPKEILEEIKKLEKSFLSSGKGVDNDAANKLKDVLQELYAADSKKENFVFDQKLEQVATGATKRLFDRVRSGPDPFIVTQEKMDRRKEQLADEDGDNPFVAISRDYNERVLREKSDRTKKDSFRKLASFGKLFSTFIMDGAAAIDGLDEVQLFFYSFNSRAGKAAGRNIAEFPIDMNVFLDQFRDHVLQRRTDRIALEEFLKLIVDAQLGDPRGPGYGLYSHFEPYDPKAKEPAIKKKDNGAYEKSLSQKENSLGPFLMPVIDVYVETSYVSQPSTGSSFDLLKSFDAQQLDASGRRGSSLTKVTRIHVFDRTNDPYPLSAALLRGDDASGYPELRDIKDKLKKIIKPTLDAHPELASLTNMDRDFGVVVKDPSTNELVKRLVSMTIPTITYGANGTMIKEMNVSTKQDALLTTTQMLANRSGRPAVTQPNGGGTMGLPLRIIPATVTMTTMGCPSLRYAQVFFIDMGSATTIDNRYVITGLTHTLAPGRFDSTVNLTFSDAYGAYENCSTYLQYLGLIEPPEANSITS